MNALNISKEIIKHAKFGRLDLSYKNLYSDELIELMPEIKRLQTLTLNLSNN